jgi:hypothetical protein
VQGLAGIGGIGDTLGSDSKQSRLKGLSPAENDRMIGSEFRITGDEAKRWLELAKKEINPLGLDNWPSRG